MNNAAAVPAATGETKTVPNVTPIKPDTVVPASVIPTAAKGNDEVMSQPAKRS